LVVHPPFRHELKNELYSNPCSFNNRLADQDTRAWDNSSLPIQIHPRNRYG
jgi:hypothetical protein